MDLTLPVLLITVGSFSFSNDRPLRLPGRWIKVHVGKIGATFR